MSPPEAPVAESAPKARRDASVEAKGHDGPGAIPETARPQQSPALRAGATDDNEEFDAFVEFLASWSDRADLAGRFDMLDVRDRRFVRVVDSRGRPVPAATVRITDLGLDRVLLSATTYGDGRAPFYPRVAMSKEREPAMAMVDGAAKSRLLVEVAAGEARKRMEWDGEGEELVVTLDSASEAPPVRLDVLFAIDTTGSMADEIDRIKATLLAVTERLRSLGMEFDLRYGAVLYRDVGDEYVTRAHPFTGDIRTFDQALQAVAAAGGGDTPESLNQGLAEAIGRMDWHDGAAKVMFLIADAPPHMDYQGDVRYGESLKAAVAKGIRVHSVAASGLDPLGTMIFRQIAQFTRGKFIFIEYGNVEESAAAHGVTGEVKSNNLDDILFEQIREEVARWGRP
jgi:Mg-chelatase subunit ChlD